MSGYPQGGGANAWNGQNGSPKGKGKKGKGKPSQQPQRASAMPTRFDGGEEVDVFHRYCQDPNGYFMVENAISGLHHPSIGKTDGWTEARVTKAWDGAHYDVSDYNSWVEIMWSHKAWYNRRGHRLDVSKPSMVTQRVPADQVRRRGTAAEAQAVPKVSIFHVRWGGEKPVDPVTEGAGGWGSIGSTPSDNYINGWEDNLWNTMGPTYEIHSAFIQNSEELRLISPGLVRMLMRGEHLGAFYFMWPIVFQDGHEYPAYVNRDRQFDLMVKMEAAGVPSRFPHHSHLYRILASKEWTAQMCLHPLLKVPLTTAVSRQAIVCNPVKAASTAITALAHLSKTRANWSLEMNQSDRKPGVAILKGVAKLGWSWEAMDVQVWNSSQDLSTSLTSLSAQPGSLVDLVFVQEWVDFDVEMRHFVVEADLADPSTFKPKKIVYTIMKSIEDNCFREFDRFDRAQTLKRCFAQDEAAMVDAERQAQELINRWLQWIQAQTHELPTVIRFDILAKRTGPGKAVVTTGELTELGGCFLGWKEGPSVVFGAMGRSILKDRAC